MPEALAVSSNFLIDGRITGLALACGLVIHYLSCFKSRESLLKTKEKHKPVVFSTLLAQGKLWQYLADIDTQAQQMFDLLVEQMKEREDVTEQLKEENQIEWICRVKSIEKSARDNVNHELIFT